MLFNLFIYCHLLVIHSFLLSHKFMTHPEHKASLFVRSKYIDDLYSLMTQLRISCQQLRQVQIKQTSHSQRNASAFVRLHCNAVQRLQGKWKLQDLEACTTVSLNLLPTCTELHVTMDSLARADKLDDLESWEAFLLWCPSRSSVLHTEEFV